MASQPHEGYLRSLQSLEFTRASVNSSKSNYGKDKPTQLRRELSKETEKTEQRVKAEVTLEFVEVKMSPRGTGV